MDYRPSQRFIQIAILVGLAVFVLVRPTPAQAQGCGDDPLNPCGPLPWTLPNLYPVASPTLYPYTPAPTIPITYTPTPTVTPTPDITLTATPTLVGTPVDPSLIETPAAEAENVINTLAPFFETEIMNVAGGNETILDMARNLGEQGGQIIGYARGLQGLNIGSLGSVITWAISMLGFVGILYIITAMVPVLLWIIDFVLKIVDAVLNLIPF